MTTGIKGCARLSYLVIKSHAAHKFGARCRSICIFAVLIFGGRKHVGPRACLQEVSCAREPSGKTLIYWPLAVAHFIFSKFNAVNKIVKHHPGPKCSACNVCRRIMNSLSLSLYFFFHVERAHQVFFMITINWVAGRNISLCGRKDGLLLVWPRRRRPSARRRRDARGPGRLD